MKTKGLFAVILLVMGFTMVAAAAIPTPVFPWGLFPDNIRPVNSFCDAQQAIMENTLLTLLPPEFTGFLSLLAPATGDLNGNSYVVIDPLVFSLNGNQMLDCSVELKVIETVLKDTTFSVNGLTHAMVRAAFVQSDAQFAVDVGSYWGLLSMLANGLPQVLLGHMCIGDGDATFSEPIPDPPYFNRVDVTGSGGFIKAVMFALGSTGYITNGDINMSLYGRMPQYFSKLGDADSDGATNECEYRFYGGGGTTPDNYVTKALDPATHPTPEECAALPEFKFEVILGGGWYAFGSNVNLSVVVSGATGNVSYVWSKDGYPISGATDNALALPAATPADSGAYMCEATDASKATISTGPIPVTVLAAGQSVPVGGIAAMLTALVAAGALAVRKLRKP